MLSTAEKLGLMQDLFVHANSAFAEQVYEEDKGIIFYPQRSGKCFHQPKHRQRDCPDITEVEFTDNHLLAHLQGKNTYAPYQLKEGMIKWICIDIDGYRSTTETMLQKATKEVANVIHEKVGPRTFLVEHSGSKGFHVWVFFEEPIEVHKGHSFGHWIVSHVDASPNIVFEVYPKQVRNKLFGNTVMLPLGIHRKTGNRCWIVNSSFEAYENPWEQLQNVRRVSSEWVDENIPHISPPSESESRSASNLDNAPLCLVNLLENGGSEGVRDEAAFRLACYLKDRAHLPEYVTESVVLTWNKKNKPPMDDDHVSMKVESAYGGEYNWFPCNSPSFDPYCSSKCHFFNLKKKYRWHNKDKDPRGIISYE